MHSQSFETSGRWKFYSQINITSHICEGHVWGIWAKCRQLGLTQYANLVSMNKMGWRACFHAVKLYDTILGELRDIVPLTIFPNTFVVTTKWSPSYLPEGTLIPWTSWSVSSLWPKNCSLDRRAAIIQFEHNSHDLLSTSTPRKARSHINDYVLQKPFDFINWEGMWSILSRLDCPQKFTSRSRWLHATMQDRDLGSLWT